MKSYERESLIKTFSIFFLSLSLLMALIAYAYYKEQRHAMEEKIVTQMRTFTYDFKSQGFGLDVVVLEEPMDELRLWRCEEGMCLYVRIEGASKSFFKVSIPLERYEALQEALAYKVLGYAMVLVALIALFALGYSLYALHPLRSALHMMEEFLKDVVHDLNTPISSMLLNITLLKKREEPKALERLELGVRSVAGLYRNLEVMHKGFTPHYAPVELEGFLKARAELFSKLYPELVFTFQTQPLMLSTDLHALERIIDNLLSNACKYNRKQGEVVLFNDATSFSIRDTGVGITHPKRIFERYYKEHVRGMGLGLNIVKTLCEALQWHIEVSSVVGEGSEIRVSWEAKQ